MNHNAFFLSAILVLVSCGVAKNAPNTPLTDDCWGGRSASVGVSLIAKVEESIKDGVKVDASYREDVLGAIVREWDVSGENAVKLYENILTCIKAKMDLEKEKISLEKAKLQNDSVLIDNKLSEHRSFKTLEGEALANKLERYGYSSYSEKIMQLLVFYKEALSEHNFILADSYRKKITQLAYDTYYRIKNNGGTPEFDPTFSKDNPVTHDLSKVAAIEENRINALLALEKHLKIDNSDSSEVAFDEAVRKATVRNNTTPEHQKQIIDLYHQ